MCHERHAEVLLHLLAACFGAQPGPDRPPLCHRRLYWRVRTRQGPMNMVGFFTRLAALVGPGLPQLLGEEGEEEAIMVTAEGPGQELRVPGQEAEDGAAAGREAGAGKAQRSRSRGPEGSPRGQQGPPVPSGPLQSHAERAALRQLVVRMMYDACR